MTTETMKKYPGVHSRKGSRVWQWRIKAPIALCAVYPSQWAHRCSLGTPDLREANLKASQLHAHWLAQFEQQRQSLNPQKVDRITPKMARFLAEKMLHDSLASDEALRTDPAEREWLLQWMRGMGMAGADAVPGRLGGIPDALADMLEELNRRDDDEIRRALARGNLMEIYPGMQYIAKQCGIQFDMDTPGVGEALQECLKAAQKAASLTLQRDSGEVVETPPAPTTKPAAALNPRTLRDVYDRWQKSGDSQRSADSIAAYGRALKQFEGQHKSVTLEDITREMGDNYRTWLRTVCNTSKTARDRLTAIKSLLKYAAETLEWIPKQPWRGVDIKATTTNKRRPWTDDELSTLFTAPLHTSYAIPKARTGGKEAAYWIPLLGLFLGSRLGELCQLRTVDVKTIDGIAVLELTNEGEGQSIKSEAGHRSVPIHSELIRLGFLDYVAAIKATGAESLWPALPLRKGKPSDLFGRWFKEYREGLGMVGAGGASFHYFRHTVRPLMRRAGISDATQDKVTGHKTQGSIGTTVYDHWTLKEIREAVEAIQFPALTLNRVYSVLKK